MLGRDEGGLLGGEGSSDILESGPSGGGGGGVCDGISDAPPDPVSVGGWSVSGSDIVSMSVLASTKGAVIEITVTAP